MEIYYFFLLEKRFGDLPLAAATFSDLDGCVYGDFDIERDEWLSELDISVSELLDVLSLELLSLELDELLLLELLLVDDDDDDDEERFFDLLRLRIDGEYVISRCFSSTFTGLFASTGDRIHCC